MEFHRNAETFANRLVPVPLLTIAVEPAADFQIDPRR